jgi:hypothetical protein
VTTQYFFGVWNQSSVGEWAYFNHKKTIPVKKLGKILSPNGYFNLLEKMAKFGDLTVAGHKAASVLPFIPHNSKRSRSF